MFKQFFAALIVAIGPGTIVAAEQTESTRPVLIVVVSVDQWCYEYFERFRDNLSEEGVAAWARNRGVWYSNCRHGHLFTKTGPGHAVLLTGCYPNRNGIIGNDWYVRGEDSDVYCVADPDTRLIGAIADDKPVSPRLLLADTLGDQLKIATRGAGKVFAVAIKDRAAILMAGRLADAAYWMSNAGHWITAAYYRDTQPGYLRQLNEQQRIARFANQPWQLLYDPSRYWHGTPENSFGERPVYGMTADFPHKMPAADGSNFIRNLACSPFGNDATLEAAEAVLISEELGQDNVPDLLAINLSSNDYVGHAYGPHSLEVEDMTYRTDLQLATFARAIDARLGAGKWVMFITADHGVAPIPELAVRWGLPAARDPLGAATDGKFAVVQGQLESYLRTQLNYSASPEIVEAVVDGQVFLNRHHPLLKPDGGAAVARLARDWLLDHEAIVAAFTREQLLSEAAGPDDELFGLAKRAFHAERSGDLLFCIAPYHFHGAAGTTHGSPWHYDRHVPLMVLGDVRHHLSTRSVSPASIAATAARLLDIPPPSLVEAEPLDEVVVTNDE